MNTKEEFLVRSQYAFYFLLFLGGAITARLVYIQHFATFKGKYWHERIEAFQIREDTIRAKRGDIYARDGSLMATSLPTYEVGIDPRVAKDTYFNAKVDSLGLLLSGLFRDKSAREYTGLVRAARQSGRRYLLLNRRHVSFEERQQMLTWPFFRTTKKLSARGGGLRAFYERYHPYGQMALRTIGDLNPYNMQGQMGLEASFQRDLAGKNAVGLVEVLAGGVKKPVDDGPDMKPEPGLDLYTTLDVNFQDIAETALKRSLMHYDADKGSVIVMDVQTGEIRALANLTKQGGGYVENINHALTGLNDPGSTFKLATMMALLEEKAIYPGKMIHTGDRAIRYYGQNIEESAGGASGSITAQQVFEKSSNVGIHLMMQSYFYSRPDLYCQYLRRFHLNQPTGIHMKGEARPFMRNPDMKGWSKTSLMFMSHGYEMQLTPLQMLTFYNAVANNGKWVQPMLVKQVKLAGEVVTETQPYTAPNPIASLETIRLVQKMLEGVVTRGTARNIQNPNYAIAGKTGTAQRLVNGVYQKNRSYYTSFIGYFPANKPKYSVLTMVDNPHGENINELYAGSVSAPVFKEVADRIYAYDIDIHAPMRMRKNKAAKSGGLLPSAGYADDLHTISTELNIDSQPAAEGWVRRREGGTWQSLPVRKDRVPDVRGLPLRDALPLLENRGLKVLAQGHGKVVRQSQEPGQALTSNRQITLTLQGGE